MNYPEQIFLLDKNKPNVILIALQASNPDGESLVASQIEAARNAAVSVLELLGAEVANNSTMFQLDPAKNETVLHVAITTDETKVEEETDTEIGDDAEN